MNIGEYRFLCSTLLGDGILSAVTGFVILEVLCEGADVARLCMFVKLNGERSLDLYFENELAYIYISIWEYFIIILLQFIWVREVLLHPMLGFKVKTKNCFPRDRILDGLVSYVK